MARQEKPVHKVQMVEGKRNIIHQLLEEYDIQSAEDIQEDLKDLLGGTIKVMMEAEMDTKISELYEKIFDNWDAISPIFKFSADVRKVIYITNAIESLNSTCHKLNRQRSVFPSDIAHLKALFYKRKASYILEMHSRRRYI